MIDSPFRVDPGDKVKLRQWRTDDTGTFKEKQQAESPTEKNVARLGELHQVLYAGAQHALLIVLQGMDTSGKDGAIRHVFAGVNPQGCSVTSFKAPSSLELSHDYLWRIHLNAPARGTIGIFNRSHYESVLVERVHTLVPRSVWSRRYDHINQFERMLADEGTLILKFFLHISKDEQKERLEARLKDKTKNWKFNVGDLDERKLWDDYQQAYEDALEKTSTDSAPWYIVPSDRKWFRNWLLSDTIVRSLEKLKLKFPPPADGLDQIRVR